MLSMTAQMTKYFYFLLNNLLNIFFISSPELLKKVMSVEKYDFKK